MLLRPLFDTLIVEPDPILKYEGLILLPDKNSEEKISPFATVVSWGGSCKHKYKVGQKIILPTVNAANYSAPTYYILNEIKYRMVKEHEINGIIED